MPKLFQERRRQWMMLLMLQFVSRQAHVRLRSDPVQLGIALTAPSLTCQRLCLTLPPTFFSRILSYPSVQEDPGVLQPSLEQMWGNKPIFTPSRCTSPTPSTSFNAHQKHITASSVANSPMVSTDHDAMSDGHHHLQGNQSGDGMAMAQCWPRALFGC